MVAADDEREVGPLTAIPVVSGRGTVLGTHTLLVSLLGFNLCTELVQLLVVALVLPPLVVLARDTAVNRVLRVAGAELAGAAALGCLADDRRGSGPVRSPAGSARAPA